jgi:hypothetical protein
LCDNNSTDGTAAIAQPTARGSSSSRSAGRPRHQGPGGDGRLAAVLDADSEPSGNCSRGGGRVVVAGRPGVHRAVVRLSGNCRRWQRASSPSRNALSRASAGWPDRSCRGVGVPRNGRADERFFAGGGPGRRLRRRWRGGNGGDGDHQPAGTGRSPADEAVFAALMLGFFLRAVPAVGTTASRGRVRCGTTEDES